MLIGARSLVAVVVSVSCTLALAGPSSARPPAGTPTGHSPGHSSPPSVRPRQGQSFVPAQGDWEGTANGFAASFELALRTNAGARRYGIKDLVILTPGGCPANAAHYGESILGGQLPSPLGRFGSFGLSRFGLQGSLGGPRSANLSAEYRVSGCHGTLVWHMHPATRAPVADGSWKAHFADGETSSFRVQAGGRLATAIGLPKTMLSCNGLEGAIDMFIGNRGGARTSNGGVTLTLRFSGDRATGTLSARGCPGTSRVTADHAG